MESERSSSEPALLMLLVEEVELVEFGIVAVQKLGDVTVTGQALYLYRQFLFTDVKLRAPHFHRQALYSLTHPCAFLSSFPFSS